MRQLKSRLGPLILVLVLGGLVTYLFQGGGLWPDESVDGRVRQLNSRWATTRREAAADLGRFTADSEKVVPALRAAVGDSDPKVRRMALGSLLRFGENAKAVGPAVRNVLEKDVDQETRRRAAEVLGAIHDEAAVPILVKTFQDRDPLVQTEAVKSLGWFGKGASSPATVDVLLSFLNTDRPEALREASLGTLYALAKDEERVARSIAAVLANDPSDLVRKKAVTLLGPNFDFSVDALVAALDDSNAEVQLSAGNKLAWIGLTDDRTVPALCHAALTARRETREGIAINIGFLLVLEKFDDKADRDKERRRFQTAVAEFRKVLETPDAAAQEAIARVLCRLIVNYVKTHRESLLEPARAAVDALIARMEDENENVKLRIEAANQWEVIQLAVQTRKSSGSDGEDRLHPATSWIKAFGGLLKSPAKSVSSKALATLSESFRYAETDASYRAAWRGLAPVIAEAAKSDDEKVRGPALKILTDLGPEAISALETLRPMALAAKDPAVRLRIEKTIQAINSMEGLKSDNPEKRAEAAASLGRIGWRADNALTSLLEVLKDPEVKVRAAAATAFGGLGEGGSSAMTPLTSMAASDPDPMARVAAIAAIAAIAPGSPAVIEVKLKALHDPDSKVRKTAALFQKVAPGTPVAKALAEALADPSDEVVQTAAASLANGLFEVPEALNALIVALGDPRQRKLVLPAIDSHLKENDAGEDFRGFRSKSKELQATVASAVPLLRTALAIEETEVSTMVYRLLGRIIESAGPIRDPQYRESLGPAVDLYLEGLERATPDIRAAIVENLDEIPTRRVEIVTALLAELKRPELPAKDRAAALHALAAQASAVESEPDFLKALEPAVPILTETLQTPDLDLRLKTVRALGRIAGNARSATPALERLAKSDSEANVRTLAETAIKAINGTVKMPPTPPKPAGGALAF